MKIKFLIALIWFLTVMACYPYIAIAPQFSRCNSIACKGNDGYYTLTEYLDKFERK